MTLKFVFIVLLLIPGIMDFLTKIFLQVGDVKPTEKGLEYTVYGLLFTFSLGLIAYLRNFIKERNAEQVAHKNEIRQILEENIKKYELLTDKINDVVSENTRHIDLNTRETSLLQDATKNLAESIRDNMKRR